jgi:transmembrane sensor
MARLWSDDASDADQADRARWRAEHPQHDLAWQRLQAFEGKLHSVPRDVARHALREPAPAAYLNRRRALKLLAVLLPVGGMLYAGAARTSGKWRRPGTARRQGNCAKSCCLTARVMLASASAIDVRYDAGERLLVLRAGEILVTTAHDPGAAVSACSRHGTVRALGTRRFPAARRTHLARGRLRGGGGSALAHAPERPRAHRGRRGRRLLGRHRAVRRPRRPARRPDKGVLVADNLRLDELLAELARYRPGLLRCDAAVAGLTSMACFPARHGPRAAQPGAGLAGADRRAHALLGHGASLPGRGLTICRPG